MIRTGRSVVIPDIDHEPLLKAKLGDRSKPGHRSFIAVPILLNRRPAGALTVELAFKSERLYDRSAKFFGVVASMIGQALKVQKLIEAERQRLVDENVHLRQELRERYDFSNLVGTSNAIRQVYEQVAQVARTNTTVLIRGESGTGKELIAHAIHYNSLRARKPFVKVSCGALPDTLMESELFGYEKGAFTDAHARRKGRFELADGGTLFLDEIGDINLPTQVKLLRVLQEREFERLGGTETVKVNVRLIAATNKALEPAIEGGTFREDLYYRLERVHDLRAAAARAEDGHPALRRSLPAEVRARARQGDPPHRHAGDRHADVAITGRATSASSRTPSSARCWCATATPSTRIICRRRCRRRLRRIRMSASR